MGFCLQQMTKEEKKRIDEVCIEFLAAHHEF